MVRNIIVEEQAKEIRALARRNLNNNWGKIFTTYFCFYLLTKVVVDVLNMLFPLNIATNQVARIVNNTGILNTSASGSIASALYTTLCSGAFALGLCIFLLNFVRKSDIQIQYIFFGFEHFIKALGLNIVYSVVVIVGTVFFIVPGIIFGIEYGQAFYILADDPNKKIMQCMRESRIMMENNKGRYFYLDLTFIGWSILASIAVSILTFTFDSDNLNVLKYIVTLIASLPVMLVSIYQETAHANFYELVSGHLVKAKKVNSDDNEENNNFSMDKETCDEQQL